jgi:hypothetical protein
MENKQTYCFSAENGDVVLTNQVTALTGEGPLPSWALARLCHTRSLTLRAENVKCCFREDQFLSLRKKKREEGQRLG